MKPRLDDAHEPEGQQRVGDRGAPLEQDRIVVTPTLGRKHPLPKLWILGRPVEGGGRQGHDYRRTDGKIARN